MQYFLEFADLRMYHKNLQICELRAPKKSLLAHLCQDYTELESDMDMIFVCRGWQGSLQYNRCCEVKVFRHLDMNLHTLSPIQRTWLQSTLPKNTKLYLYRQIYISRIEYKVFYKYLFKKICIYQIIK